MMPVYFFFLPIFQLYPADQFRSRDAVVARLERKEKESPDSGQVYRFARIDNDSVVYATRLFLVVVTSLQRGYHPPIAFVFLRLVFYAKS